MNIVKEFDSLSQWFDFTHYCSTVLSLLVSYFPPFQNQYSCLQGVNMIICFLPGPALVIWLAGVAIVHYSLMQALVNTPKKLTITILVTSMMRDASIN